MIGVLLVVVLGGAFAAWYVLRDSDSGAAPIPSIQARDYSRQTIYRSPQAPGFTSWLGAWTMPDASLRVAFVQATGPVDPSQRDRAPANVLEAFGVSSWPATRDFWGLDTAVKYLRPAAGRKWQVYRSEPFRALYSQPFTPQPTFALEDGTLIRRVNGDDLRSDPALPHTAYLQRSAPGSQRWEGRQLLMDPAKFTYQITRIRRLRDGRLVAVGNYWPVPASTKPPERAKVPATFLLMVSDNDGKSWKKALTPPKSLESRPGGEWDVGELPDGDLAAVMRVTDPAAPEAQVRKQALLRKDGDGWRMTDIRNAPFPHSGHPELLATREGPVLHVATTGVHYTKDGIHWRRLDFTPRRAYKSNYYPRAVQTKDGVVHVLGHVGADDPYGQTKQSITEDTFRLAPDPGTGASRP